MLSACIPKVLVLVYLMEYSRADILRKGEAFRVDRWLSELLSVGGFTSRARESRGRGFDMSISMCIHPAFGGGQFERRTNFLEQVTGSNNN